MKKLISWILVCLFLINCMTFTISANEMNATEMSEVEKLTSYVEAIERELEMAGGSVNIGFDRLISELKLKKATLTDESEIANAERLISIAESQKAQYNQLKSGVAPCGGYVPVYSEAVSAVIAVFGYEGCLLSAELLMHAVDNTNPYSSYNNPLYIDRVRHSEVVYNIKNNLFSGGDRFGSSSFEPEAGNVIKMDLYYSIHSFSYYATSNTGGEFVLHDYYDFALGDYEGVAGIAIDTMWLAQQYGAITPFNINILV